MRADRLVAIVLLLQTHKRMTAPDLAERLETSERTIRRDLEALSGAGVPVYSQRGRGGGWALLGGHRIDLSGLTTEEAEALFLVAGPQALAGLGVEPGVRSALRKLLAALPAPLREHAAAAHGAVHVDSSRWGDSRAGRDDRPHHLGELRSAVVDGVQVDLAYAKPGSEPATRRIHPFGLVAKSGVWYLLAGTEAGLRTFRVSRVRAVTRTDEPVERPDNFDLPRAWEAARDAFPRRLATLAVDLRVDPEVQPWLTRVLSGWADLTAVDNGGGAWPACRATFPNAAVAARQLAPFGERVTVLRPRAVRDELARLGRELVHLYAPDAR